MILCSIISYGQDYAMKGNAAYNNGNFTAAITYFSKYDKINLDADLLERRGMSYYHVNDLNKAIRDFTIAKKLGNSNPDMYYRMGVIKQNLGELDEAMFFYKTFIDQVEYKHVDYKRAVCELKNCIYTAFYQADEQVATIQSFGDDVNTPYDEIYPIRSPRYGNVYYLSTNRNKNDFQIDAFSIDKKGDWSQVSEIVEDINTAKHDYLQDVSADGRSLLYLKQGAEPLDNKLTFSTYIDDEEIQINIPRIVLKSVTDVQIVDHSTLAFSSDKLVGYGGYDIYTIAYTDGEWSEPQNLGPTVNTMYDDRFPFFINGMKQLYYSSNRPYSYGGFDIYYYDLSKDEKALNIGQPINTPGDDINFRLDADGQTAIYSSNTKTGNGGYDLYFAYIQDLKKLEPRDSIRFQYVEDIINIEQRKKDDALALQNEKIAAEEEANRIKKKEAEALAARIQAEEEREKKKQMQIADADKLKQELIAKKESTAKRKEEESKKQKAIAEAEKLEKEKQMAAEKDKESKEKIEAEKLAKRKKEQEAEALAAMEKAEKEKQEAENLNLPAEVVTTEHAEETKSSATIKELITKDYKLRKLKAIDSYIIYYRDRQDILNEKNKAIIHAMALNLLENEDHHIRLLAYTDDNEPGLPEFVQYNTLLRAKSVSDYMIDLGIEADRIHIESMAANYPAARREVAGQENKDFYYINKRIETQIIIPNGKIIQDHRIDPTLMSLAHRDRKYILFQDIRDELYYSVKVASTPRIFKNAILRMYNDIYVRKESGIADNDYYIGIYTKYADAKALQEQISTSSAPLSEIVAFYNGKPIAPEDIKALSAEYPDLSNYGQQ